MMEKPKTVLAVRHVAFENLGSFEPILRKQGYTIRYLEAGMDALAPVDTLGPDLLVILGGPIGAYEEESYPFLQDELRLLEKRLKADRPTVGICLGSQLMARALGARVYPGHRKEIGWAPVTLTEAGRQSCLRPIAEETTLVLHWHGDTFDLPDGAIRLASTPFYENQAFAWRRNALALQFHLEVTVRSLEGWFIGHASEIAGTKGISVGRLRHDTARWGPLMEKYGPRCFELWLLEMGRS
jgi:GMP synthase (glutamine-hydrolysing)